MTQIECTKLLELHGIKPTANRIVVVRELATAGYPMTLNELEMKILSIDKSGIFRALTLFREHHLVHTLDDTAGTRYELCHSHSTHEDDDLHVHFVCEQCGRTYCLDSVPVPRVALPPGFIMTSASHVVKGVCGHCATASKVC